MSSDTGEETGPDSQLTPWRDRTVAVVLASTALAPLGVPLISPALPAVRDALGVTEVQASLLVSGYFVVGIALSPFVGLLADRLGRKRVLVAGLAVFGVLGAAIAFADSFTVVLGLRVLQGTGAAAIFITTVTIIGDRFEGARRNAVLGYNVAVLSAGAAVFPLLGGVLVTVDWSLPFLAYLAAVPVAIAAAVVVEEPARAPTGRGAAYLREAASAVATPAVLSLFGITFLTEFLAFGVVFTAVPFLLEDALSPPQVGGVLFLAETAAALGAVTSGRLARRLSNGRILALALACYGVGFAGVWAVGRPALVAAPLVLVGAGLGVLLPTVDAALGGRIPSDYRAGAFSLRNSTTFLGRAAGPYAFAALALTAGLGYEPLLLAAGVVAVVAAVPVALLL